ncbi:hypothetical protein cypCar_00020110 [Cyprinus carpio]|nr:hypothetical protein cypCar_00020110 [Cyprinus carpio]
MLIGNSPVLQVMLEALRVTELRLLLSQMGKSKSGLKKDLMKRVVDLLHNECNPELLSAVRELHKLRQVSKDARRSSKPSPVEIISMPACVSPENPQSPISVCTEPQMIKLPFYQTLDTILPPTPLDASVECVFRICYSESIGVEEDQYPPNISVLVNHANCLIECTYSSNKLGTEPSRPCRPIDLTPNLYLTFTNRLSVLWGNFGKLAKMRMSVPCRARGCAHLQCFDASFYLQMNERKPRWTCPVCHRYAPFDELLIDSLLCDVLESCGEDEEEIEYLSDSSWRATRHDKSDKNKERVQHQQIKHRKISHLQFCVLMIERNGLI